MHTSGDPALPWGNDSQYNVPSRDRVPFAYRLGVLSDLLFMFRILKRVVAPARRLAVKGNYGQAPMIRDSVETLRVIEEVGIGVHIDGLEHMQSLGGPAVVTANHMSILDTFVTPCMIAPYCKVCYVAKDALGRGFFGPIMRSLDPILVERQDPRADFKTVMNEGLERIARGYSVMVFPQSTRMVRFDPWGKNWRGKPGCRWCRWQLRAMFMCRAGSFANWGMCSRRKSCTWPLGRRWTPVCLPRKCMRGWWPSLRSGCGGGAWRSPRKRLKNRPCAASQKSEEWRQVADAAERRKRCTLKGVRPFEALSAWSSEGVILRIAPSINPSLLLSKWLQVMSCY